MRYRARKIYDIETDWVIDSLCNFDCHYCFSHSNVEFPATGKLSCEEIVKFFDNTGLIWLIHITGGEPFLYPNFVRLCQGLTKKHFININTNLTQGNVFDFAELIDPGRVTFINCGLHILEREKRNLVGDFLTKINLLKKKGFKFFVSYVMHPLLFQRFEKDFRYFKSKGVIIYPKALRGVFDGKRYPESYSKEEKRVFIKFSKRSEKLDKMRNISPAGVPIIDLTLDREFLKGKLDFQGKPCLAGKRFVRIWPSGVITRCGKKHILGNLFDSKLHLFKKERKCDDYSCPYFCFKYSSKS